MNRLLLLIGVILLGSVRITIAQGSKTPEFQLVIQYDEKGNHQRPRQFGYDPSATFGTDTAFGETRDVPQSSPGDQVPNLYFLYSNDTFVPADTGTWTDILPKPSADSFYLQYPLEISTLNYPATLSWDKSLIPSQITGIWLTPRFHPDQVLADMKQVSSYNITAQDYFNNGIDYMITLFYNMTPAPKLPASVRSDRMVTGLVSNVSAYPNPFIATGRLTYDLAKNATVAVQVYDLTGREVAQVASVQPGGHNGLDLDQIIHDRGSYFVRLQVMVDGSMQEKTLLVKHD
jgi:hypothetical protein